MLRTSLTGFFMALCCFSAQAQNRAIGQWRSHYPYNSVTAVATDGNQIFAAARHGVFSYNIATGEIITYSKTDGMSDAGTDKIGYDVVTGTTLITYTNGNIDLYRNGSFYNIPSLRLRAATGSKEVHDIFIRNGLAYLSTDIGILVLDLERQEVKENYEFNNSSNAVATYALNVYDGYYYVATSAGLFRAPVNTTNLQDFSSWQQISSGALTSLTRDNTYLWAGMSEGVLRFNPSVSLTPDTVYRSPLVVHLAPAASGNGIITTETGTVNGYVIGRHYVLHAATGRPVDSFYSGLPHMALPLPDGRYVVADEYRGLLLRSSGLEGSSVIPSGPAFPYAYRIEAHDRNLTVLHGGFNRLYQPNGTPGRVSVYEPEADRWRINDSVAAAGANSLVDLEQTAEGTWYGSMTRGLFLRKTDGTVINAGAGILEPYYDDATQQQVGVTSLAKDLDGNLIAGQYKAAAYEIVVRTPEGQWVKWAANGSSFVGGLPRTAGGLVVDDYNQKWWFQPRGGGVFVYDDNHTPANLSDDQSVHLGTGRGGGGLPSEAVLSLAKDKDGAIWIGTENGIGIVSCPGSVMTRQCEAVQPPQQYDNFAGLFFENEQVQTIAVDGGNRKWIGTNNGVWLLSPDGKQILERFTNSNSPLPANTIQHIAVDDVTGDVYISTTEGLVSYRSTATEGTETGETIEVFPNPVRSGYTGTIALRNLPANADVRITDIAGQLVYRTQATGGQATWNGKDYTGKRPATGVYLVFVTSKDGLITTKGKLVFAE